MTSLRVQKTYGVKSLVQCFSVEYHKINDAAKEPGASKSRKILHAVTNSKTWNLEKKLLWQPQILRSLLNWKGEKLNKLKYTLLKAGKFCY